MAHYAKIDENNVVERVEKLDDFYEWTDTGELSEQNAIAYLRKIWGESTNWVKTSYNANIRGMYAGIGDIYRADLDKFVSAKPAGMDSWVFNEEILQWEPPIPMPPANEERTWEWNEELQKWDEELQ
ncbi:hypothetical protein SSSM5_044 [Synechococcus phage S-SSM5]|uniref:Uncharacterized protein n=1 Tax=Synechococcus phage S-SSM5 TaxID=445685 RepID=E3SK84_9CAUD|nr:hypothetical protein SSSM5_044 [Synechococcus phage S-SSM5]ADO98026.1 hypothetical protein SSSM5_044 [Synechococcus phage S-SSM5]